jgi:hypothetical protein
MESRYVATIQCNEIFPKIQAFLLFPSRTSKPSIFIRPKPLGQLSFPSPKPNKLRPGLAPAWRRAGVRARGLGF